MWTHGNLLIPVNRMFFVKSHVFASAEHLIAVGRWGPSYAIRNVVRWLNGTQEFSSDFILLCDVPPEDKPYRQWTTLPDYRYRYSEIQSQHDYNMHVKRRMPQILLGLQSGAANEQIVRDTQSIMCAREKMGTSTETERQGSWLRDSACFTFHTVNQFMMRAQKAAL